MLQWEEWIKYYKTKTIYDTSQKENHRIDYIPSSTIRQ